MSETPNTSEVTPAAANAPVAAPSVDIAAGAVSDAAPAPAPGRGLLWLGLLALGVVVALLAWWFDARLGAIQAEVARRLQAADTTAVEARTIARQTADAARDFNARLAVLESREQDLAAQRQALQQLYQDFAKTRDDAFLGQTAELIALAQQQAQLSGSLGPLLSTLASAQQRLKRAGGPRAAMVLRAVQADMGRLKSSVAPDVPAAAQRLDELAALVDELQPVASAAPLEGHGARRAARAPAHAASAPGWAAWAQRWAGAAWSEVRQLVTITRVDQPGMLLAAPQQIDDLRANLKLRVLNARLDLLARNVGGYRSDMQAIDAALRASFNLRQPRTQQALSLAAQAAQINLAAQPAANLQSLAVLGSLGLGSD